jgi:2-oxoglutarate dehydrogenase E1 component
MNQMPEFHGPNAAYAIELYERFRENPASVDPETRGLFERGLVPSAPTASVPLPVEGTGPDLDAVIRAARVARIVREMGHAAARIDPLGNPPPGDPELDLAYHGLTDADLETMPPSVVGGPLALGAANARVALERLRAAYSGPVGYEDDHIQEPEERNWLREAVESGRFFATVTDDDRRQLLERLTDVDTFEQFLHKVQPYQGQKRFSIEGLDILVPVLDAIIADAAVEGTHEVVIGMAHRGRLNVLAHVLGKPYEAILAEFPTKLNAAEALPGSSAGTHGYTGDVKYHKGYRRDYRGDGDVAMPITLAPNPSHLEFVNPAVIGRARAAQESRGAAGAPVQEWRASLAILIHGDAAFPGQGVVAETLNLSQIPGYRVGGTIHIIANNQVGFTTDPRDGRSTWYASDLAKGFEIPIVHVNGDDPEACLAIARMAIAYREQFGKDFLIDLVGYRRWGHNETDEPRYTQPRMYQAIDARPRLRELWADSLIGRGLLTREQADAQVATVREKLVQAKAVAMTRGRGGALAGNDDPAAFKEPFTAIDAERLRTLNAFLNGVPDDFTPHPKQESTVLATRRAALDSVEPAINWGHAEALAFGSLLEDGTPIRLSGQDSERGTFSQRMVVLHSPGDGTRYCAMDHLPSARASFAVYNSPLSEMAALGFEYGYSVHATETLVLWEAQYGDFVNGAQVIIDQFIVSGHAKWGQSPSVVMLLPHGYEGSGPEHSSARLERFLQLCASENLRVANCTTPAQYFHLLRRQAAQLASRPRPLVIMTPKSLLRHKSALSSLADLSEGRFHPVLGDPRPAERCAEVTRLILCSGKVAVDLAGASIDRQQPEFAGADRVAVARVELLNPFPAAEIAAELARFPGLQEVIWLQEEPKNMGAWTFVAPKLAELLPNGVVLRYIGRPEEASPAEGSITAHNAEQFRIVSAAFFSVPERVKSGRNGHRNGVGGTTGAISKESLTDAR